MPSPASTRPGASGRSSGIGAPHHVPTSRPSSYDHDREAVGQQPRSVGAPAAARSRRCGKLRRRDSAARRRAPACRRRLRRVGGRHLRARPRRRATARACPASQANAASLAAGGASRRRRRRASCAPRTRGRAPARPPSAPGWWPSAWTTSGKMRTRSSGGCSPCQKRVSSRSGSSASGSAASSAENATVADRDRLEDPGSGRSGRTGLIGGGVACARRAGRRGSACGTGAASRRAPGGRCCGPRSRRRCVRAREPRDVGGRVRQRRRAPPRSATRWPQLSVVPAVGGSP